MMKVVKNRSETSKSGHQRSGHLFLPRDWRNVICDDNESSMFVLFRHRFQINKYLFNLSLFTINCVIICANIEQTIV